MELRELTTRVEEVCRTAGTHALHDQLIPHQMGTAGAVNSLSVRQYTAQTDAHLHKFMLDALDKIEPHPEFWDYDGDRHPGDRFWCIGNIDGGINFARNLSEWTITVSLMEMNEKGSVYPILGVVHAPALDITYMAARGEGAVRVRRMLTTEKRERVIPSTTQSLKNSVLCFGMSYFRAESRRALATVSALSGLPADIKRIGPVSLDLCKVADGTYDAYFEPSLHSWDIPAVSAGAIVVWEAQGHLSRWDGSLINWHEANDIVATNGLVDDQLMRFLRPRADNPTVSNPSDDLRIEETQQIEPVHPDNL